MESGSEYFRCDSLLATKNGASEQVAKVFKKIKRMQDRTADVEGDNSADFQNEIQADFQNRTKQPICPVSKIGYFAPFSKSAIFSRHIFKSQIYIIQYQRRLQQAGNGISRRPA